MSIFGSTELPPAAPQWVVTPDTRPACERLGHLFAQQRAATGEYTVWLFCRRCGKARKIGTVTR